MATTGDLSAENSKRFTNASSLLARSHGDCAHPSAPNFFSMPAPAARFVFDSGMTQRGACRNTAGPNGMRGLMLQRSRRPCGAIDCRQPRYPQKLSKDRRFCDPASRQVCLCQLSARRPRSTHLSWTDIVRVSCVVSPSRRHRRPVRREPSINTRSPGTRANLSHIADITRRARVSTAMNSSPIRDVRTKSRQRLSDLCHMRDVRNARKKRGRISCPSHNDHRGLLHLLLSHSDYFRPICCTPIRTADMSRMTGGKRACARNLKRRWCFGSPAFVPSALGDPWLCGPASRQVCLFVQPIRRP